MLDKFFCNKCNFKSYSIIKMAIHLKKAHNSKFTKKDWIFVLKHNVTIQVLKIIIKLPLVLILFVIWCICCPFLAIKEFIENIL